MVRIATPAQLGHQIRALRRQRNLSQAALGKKIGLSQERISVIENHSERISVDQLLTVLMALGANLVLQEKDSPSEEKPRNVLPPSGEDW